ncbi:MAG: hypothetical protein HGA19_23450 [Oscillochloris sp.]|nr:hypothetical protein [Oscillochloris sp.]
MGRFPAACDAVGRTEISKYPADLTYADGGAIADLFGFPGWIDNVEVEAGSDWCAGGDDLCRLPIHDQPEVV